MSTRKATKSSYKVKLIYNFNSKQVEFEVGGFMRMILEGYAADS